MSELMPDGTPRSGLSQGTITDLLRERIEAMREVERLQKDNILLAGAMRKWEVAMGAGSLPAIGRDASLAYDRALDS